MKNLAIRKVFAISDSDYKMIWTIQSIYFLKALSPRISKLLLPSVGYTNTQIQIHKYTNTAMTKCQIDPTCGIFLKRGLFKGIKNYNPIQYKLEHLSFAQLYEVYFFEKRIVQGYQKLYSNVLKAQIQKYKYKIHKYSI